MTRIRRILLAATCLLIASAHAAPAQQTVSIDIHGPGQKKLNLLVARPRPLDQGALPEIGRATSRRLAANLRLMPFLELRDPQTILGGAGLGGVKRSAIDFDRFKLERIDLLLTTGWEEGATDRQGTVQFRVYEVFTGHLLLGRRYQDVDPGRVGSVARAFCAELMEALAGRGDFFTSLLAFTGEHEGRKEIWTVRPTGEDLRQVTRLGGYNLSPTWSFDGRRLAFTHVGEERHELGLWNLASGRISTTVLKGSSIIGPTFLPDGRLALTLDYTGRPDIYLLDTRLKVDKPIVQSWAIDVSPSFDATSKKMAFVSGRRGNPHIFLLDTTSGRVKRITTRGKYNTSPCLTPDGRLLAFSRQTPQGHRIFLHDLETGREKQISFGPGNDEDPEWAPDGYFLAFTSNRTGKYRVYLTTRHGDEPRAVDTGPGEAKFPAWRTLPK